MTLLEREYMKIESKGINLLSITYQNEDLEFLFQKILNDSLTRTVDNYANHLKNSVKEITSCSNKKNFSLRASNVKVNKKLLN